MPRMHADELDVDDALVQVLVAEQFPEWAGLPVERIEPGGTVHLIFRLGDELSIRLPRRLGPTVAEDDEHTWLPRLAPHLPLQIPLPVARGRPGAGYPWYWSVHTWIEGENAITTPLPDDEQTADDLAAFVAALQRIDATGGPEPAGGRGKPLAWRDEAVRDALERVKAPGALERWDEWARAPEWEGAPVWMHADLDARNVIVRDGRLAAVIDWGGMGVGDPAVDLMAAWKFLSAPQRERFRETLGIDDDTWTRAHGWVLSQSLIALGYYTLETNPTLVREARRWLAEVNAG